VRRIAFGCAGRTLAGDGPATTTTFVWKPRRLSETPCLGELAPAVWANPLAAEGTGCGRGHRPGNYGRLPPCPRIFSAAPGSFWRVATFHRNWYVSLYNNNENYATQQQNGSRRVSGQGGRSVSRSQHHVVPASAALCSAMRRTAVQVRARRKVQRGELSLDARAASALSPGALASPGALGQLLGRAVRPPPADRSHCG
jgi:hypothetical protein